MKTKKVDIVSVYKLQGDRSTYIVTVERLNNSLYGNPRFKVVVIDLKSEDHSLYNKVYKIEDYGDDLQIAEKAVKEFEKHLQEE